MFSRDKLQPLAERHGINTFYLFGSYADATCDQDSDLDLAFLSLNYTDYGLLYYELQEKFDITVDLINLQKAPLSFVFNIIREGKVVLDLDQDRRTDFEDDIVRRYLDFAVFQRLAQAEVRSRFEVT